MRPGQRVTVKVKEAFAPPASAVTGRVPVLCATDKPAPSVTSSAERASALTSAPPVLETTTVIVALNPSVS